MRRASRLAGTNPSKSSTCVIKSASKKASSSKRAAKSVEEDGKPAHDQLEERLRPQAVGKQRIEGDQCEMEDHDRTQGLSRQAVGRFRVR